MTNKIENNEAIVDRCGFICFILKYTEVHDNYGESIWRLISTQWQPWWIRILKYKIINVLGNTAIDWHNAASKDKTNYNDKKKTDIITYILSIILSSSNTYLLPTVKFPWGCPKFQHKFRYLPIDILFHRYLQQCLLKLTMMKDNL